MTPSVLFVNHRDQACGVQQMGQKYYNVLQHSKNYACHYIDPAEAHEFDYWLDFIRPDIVLYNWYTSGATMPWLTREKIERQRHRVKQATIYHEGGYDHMGFDLIFHQDPSFNGEGFATPTAKLTRPIPEYTPSKINNIVPIFSSFGFGMGGKNFHEIVRKVNDEYENAIININIPFAKFGDADGNGARSYKSLCQQQITKPGIALNITHDLLPEKDLLDFLSNSNLICMLYDENYGRGISGTLDYALAVDRPIAITKSWQFKHIWSIDDRVLINNRSLHDMITQGSKYLNKFKDIWSSDALVNSFELGFQFLGV